MNDNTTRYSLAPAGYLILQNSDEARETNEYRRSFGPYFGVDRLPVLFPPDIEIRQLIGEPAVENDHLAATLDEWFDFLLGNTAFIPDRSQALRLLRAFHEFDYPFELVFCQLAWKQGEEERLAAYATTDEAPPVASQTLGFDVSWPSCNHSAILQPGVVPSNPPWRAKLNEYGLLNDYEDAARLRQEYLMVYPHPPFDVFVVHKIEPD